MKKLALVLFLTSISHFTFAQNCNAILLGQIVDFHDNTPLTGATIKITGKTKSFYTGFDGKFRFNGLCNGVIELEVFHPDCKTQFVSIEILGDTFKKISLEHHLEELDEVKVVGDLVKEQTNSALEKTLKVTTIEQYSGKSIGEALKEIPGLASLNTGSNIVKPSIHGLNGSRVIMLNDGVRMQDMEWGEEHAPNIDINGSGSITVIKGAAALQYGGDAIGGVIVVSPQKMVRIDSLFGKTLLSGMTNGKGGNISTELTKTFQNGWFVQAQASFKRLGDRKAPNYVLSNTGVSEKAAKLNFGKRLFNWGWAAKYAYFDTELAILRASHIGNVDDLILGINTDTPLVIEPFTYDIASPRQEVAHHIGSLNVYKRFQGTGKWNLQYDFQNNRRFEYDIRVGDDRDKAAIDLELMTHTIATDFILDGNADYTITYGLMGRYQNNFANPATGVRRLIPDYDKYDFGAFVISEFQINDNMVIDAGLRYDFNRIDAKKFYQTSRWQERGYDQEFQDLVIEDLGSQLLVNPVLNYNNISATGGFQHTINNESDIRLNYALSQRAPNPSELFSDGLHHSAARIELGDIRMQSEMSHKVSLSNSRDFKSWGYTIEPYVNFINDFIFLEPTNIEFTIRGAFPVSSYRQTNARFLGVDVSSYFNYGQFWQSQHIFSIVKAKDLTRNTALINIPAANFRNKLSYSMPAWNNLEIGIQSNYVFQQNEFPDNIMVFSPEQQQEIELNINSSPNAYHLISINTKFDVIEFNKTKLSASVIVDNLLNTNYREYLNRQRLFANDLGRNITLQLKINY